MQKYIDRLSGTNATIISGLFLLASFILMLRKIDIPLDPAWITIAISGLPLFYYAFINLFLRRKITASVLISIAIIASIFIGELFAAGEVAFIMAIGGLLEDWTICRAKRGITQLINLAPQQARIIKEDGSETTVSIDKVAIGDKLKILPGETIPVDGKIIAGSTSIDQSTMTGESLPADKGVNDNVYSGTINRYGSIDIIASKIGKDSSLQKMIALVKEAEEKKAPTARIVDRWASWLVPIALLIAIITYFATSDIVRAVTVLVVFCPCALALATPVSIAAAIGQATKHGALVKSGEALEKMGRVSTIAFDKTGTLTCGDLSVSDVISFSQKYTEDEILKIAFSIETRSEHPLAKAVVKSAQDKGFVQYKVQNFKMFPGEGVQGEIDGKKVVCGNLAFLEKNNIKIDEAALDEFKELRTQGKALIIIGTENNCIGAIALSDTIREKAASVIKALEKMGTKVILLTGDNKHAAQHFAEISGIKKVYSELLPKDKMNIISNLQKEGQEICMVGDGVNDAPTLKTADVGIAMGSIGSDIALEASDIALMNDNIENIPYLKRLSNSTISTIKINISMSMIINFFAIALSVMGVLNPVTGALVHNASSVLVVLNAALLYDRKFI